MRAKLQECRSRRAKILILSAVFLLAAFTFAGMAEARSFLVYNTSAPAQAYFIVNGTTGNVGIGLMNPAYPLDVSGAGRFSGNLYLGTAGRYVYDTGSIIGVSSGLSLGGNLDLGGNNFTNYNYLYSNDSAKLNGQSSSYYLDTSSTAQTKSGSLTVTGAWLNATNLNVSSNGYFGGNVGIGTASPGSMLHVKRGGSGDWVTIEGTAGGQLYLGTGSTMGGYIETSTGNITFRPATSERMRITTDGNVGIGITSPGARLDTQGMLRVTSLTSTPTSGRGLELWFETDTNYSVINSYNRGVGSLPIKYSAYNHTFEITGVPKMVIDNNGNVGIGTASPGSGIEFAGTSGTYGGQMRVTDGTEGYPPYTFRTSSNSGMGSFAANTVGFSIGGTEKVRIDSSGNIAFMGTSAKAARINSGSYTGDGTANRAIAHGLGVTPKMVTVVTDYSGTGRSLYLRPGYWNYFSATENNVMTAVTSADATNFYVSTNYYANNQNTANYWWVAYG